jgi:hypothetical protein
MAFNVNDFKSNGLVDQGARPALFGVRIPALPVDVDDRAIQQLEFMVTAASLPPFMIDPIEVPYFGRRIKVPGERTFQNWQTTIYNDEDFSLRNMFESWSNKMNSLVSNRYISSQNDLQDYKVNGMLVFQYGKAGPGPGSAIGASGDTGIIRGYEFHGVWPSQVDAIQLDWGRTNQIETFDVTFCLDYFHPALEYSGLTYKFDQDGVSAVAETNGTSA